MKKPSSSTSSPAATTLFFLEERVYWGRGAGLPAERGRGGAFECVFGRRVAANRGRGLGQGFRRGLWAGERGRADDGKGGSGTGGARLGKGNGRLVAPRRRWSGRGLAAGRRGGVG
ncbi:hypothetical protein Salat_0283300 [Sesamum alatum]|uniref:Uncharacterized protein n=1 Tax=Sesamum alatum TaxID=300844 RepID=A0AAE1YZS1_9LAMI|nr:hypothetical protein Salat_0283300 [Sesamum alatum]